MESEKICLKIEDRMLRNRKDIYFEQELLEGECDMPKFNVDVLVDILRTDNLSVSQKLYECPVCKSHFEHIVSFIKCCSGHVPELKLTEEDAVKEETTEVVVAPIRIKIKTEKVVSVENGDSDADYTESEATDDDDEDYEEETEKTKPRKKGAWRLKRAIPTPEGAVMCCPICSKTFTRRQFYRDHMDCHENPLLKCCQLCATEFSNGINAKKHKKKFHPELYQKEVEERREQRKQEGKRKFTTPVFKVLEKPAATKGSKKSVDKKPVKRSLREQPKTMKLIIDMEKIYLPGFMENNWVFLPKDGSDYPWVLRKPNLRVQDSKIKVETKSKIDVKLKDLEPLIQLKVEPKTEPTTHEETQNIVNNSDDVKDEPDDEDYDDYTIDYEFPTEMDDGDDPDKSNEPEEKRNWEKIDDTQYPQFPGAKYIFDVYSEKRKAKGRELRKLRREGREQGKVMPPLRPPGRPPRTDRPKKHWTHYRPDPKTCMICGSVRSNSNLRRHVAKHCIEEDELICRICRHEASNPNRLKEHYVRIHDIKFREHLYNVTKDRIESNKNNKSGGTHHTCEVCFTNLKNENDLQYHTQILHNYTGGKPKGKLECDLCDKKFATVQNRNLHMRRIHKQLMDGSVYCDYCGKGFLGKGYLISHFRGVHFDENGDFKEHVYVEKKRYKRPSKKVLVDSAKLAEHFEKYKVHSVCEICGLIKESRFAMMRHRYTKHDILDEGYSKALEVDRIEKDCQQCGKHFTSLLKWRYHENYHIKAQKGNECPICGLKCRTKTFYNEHVGRHGERNLTCDIDGCDRAFAIERDLAMHKHRVHTNSLDHVCKICGAAFKTYLHRKYHLERDHGIVKPKGAPRPKNTRQKITDGAGEGTSKRDREEHDCQYCGKHFNSVRKWRNHEYYHEKEKKDLHCTVCGAKCKTEYYLKSHMERHGEIKFFCDYEGCGKGFAVKHDVKIHKLRAHSTALSYICDICGTAFRTWNYRRYHQETVHGLVKQTRKNSKPPQRRGKEPKVVVQQREEPAQEIIIQQQMTPISIGSSPSYSQNTTDQIFQYPNPYQTHIVSQIFK